MTDHQYAYPFDPTGESNENLIVKESHIISPPDYTDFYFVVPAVGPFFEHNLVIQHWPTGRILVNGVDFVLSYKFLGASRATAKPVYGAISIYDREISGVLEITYQTLGGPWTINEAKAAELLSNAMNNPRTTTWEQVVDLPQTFPVIDHEWDLVDMVGASEVKDAIDRVTDTLLDTGGGGTGDAHASNRDNPHQVTKAQVGLGSVENFTVASFSEGNDPSVTNRYMTPQRTAQLIDSYIGNIVSAHIDSEENPHNVTKTQVGLSNVPNYRLASSSEAVDPVVDNRFVTPKSVHEAIQFVAIAALDEHKLDADNPHDVTKAQVGLDRVENYAVASEAVARDGSSQIHYLTPHGANLLLEAKVGSGVVEHIDARDNPHQVTQSQVGLGNVPNFSMADVTIAIAGEAQDRFMSPYHTKLLIESMVSNANDTLVDLINGHTSDFTNPHGVTKAQVGLGKVQDYDVASSADAIEGTRTDLYVTPNAANALVSDRITSAFDGFVAEDSSRLEGQTLAQVSSQIVGVVQPAITQTSDDLATLDQKVDANQQTFVSHQTDTNNPHGVTKFQVGLGSVPNFSVASQAEAENGIATDRFVTPALVTAAIAVQASALVDEHAMKVDNPHDVTKAQIGLGSVDNYPTASLEEAQEGTATNRFMTPALVASAIVEQAGAAVSDHIDDTSNPHQVTKVQIGLGNVENFPVADSAIAADENNATRYMTPMVTHEVAQSIFDRGLTDTINPQLQGLQTQVTENGQAASDHAARTDNPHGVTKDQIGLGDVDNFSTATEAEALDPLVNNRFTTPQRVHEALLAEVDPRFQTQQTALSAVQQALSDHEGLRDNPHEVTKAQVGLSNVQNFPMATNVEALQPERTDRYMSPSNVGAVMDERLDPIEQGLASVTDTVTRNFNNVLYRTSYVGHSGSAPQYQAVAAMTVSQARYDQLLLNSAAVLQATYHSKIPTGLSLTQLVSVSFDSNVGSPVINEVSLLNEVESVFSIAVETDSGAGEVTLTLWRRVAQNEATSSLVMHTRIAELEDVLDGPFVGTLPAQAVSAPNRSIEYSYRLADAIEEEIGLVVAALDA